MKLQNYIVFLFFCCKFSVSSAQGSYAPAAGMPGSTAIDKEDTAIQAWVKSVEINRGLQDLAQPQLGITSVGDSSSVLGKADFKVVSLGDGGSAIVSFGNPLFNGAGADFAVFENGFSDTFLELAYVEVSSDGKNFHRFDAHSLTDTSNSIGSFGTLDPRNLNNLAGKYRGGFGTPFDLEELKNRPGLDINQITHIKIIDVVGSLRNDFARRDAVGNKINDPYPTPFPSGGFDLDAVAAFYLQPVGLENQHLKKEVKAYPNPVIDILHLPEEWSNAAYSLFDRRGREIMQGVLDQNLLRLSALKKGLYFLSLQKAGRRASLKLIKS